MDWEYLTYLSLGLYAFRVDLNGRLSLPPHYVISFRALSLSLSNTSLLHARVSHARKRHECCTYKHIFIYIYGIVKAPCVPFRHKSLCGHNHQNKRARSHRISSCWLIRNQRMVASTVLDGCFFLFSLLSRVHAINKQHTHHNPPPTPYRVAFWRQPHCENTPQNTVRESQHNNVQSVSVFVFV